MYVLIIFWIPETATVTSTSCHYNSAPRLECGAGQSIESGHGETKCRGGSVAKAGRVKAGNVTKLHFRGLMDKPKLGEDVKYDWGWCAIPRF